jgi:hypothetical protein
MSHKENKKLIRKNSDPDGFDYEKSKDNRKTNAKGRPSRKIFDKIRIEFIKLKKEQQREEAKMKYLKSFNDNIEN